MFPVDTNEFTALREALEKLSLNDASFSFEAETSAALGFGFRCGFLGLLHMEVIRDRLSREFNLELISTAPSVVYQMHMTDGVRFDLHNPADMPEVTKIAEIEEPWIKARLSIGYRSTRWCLISMIGLNQSLRDMPVLIMPLIIIGLEIWSRCLFWSMVTRSMRYR